MLVCSILDDLWFAVKVWAQSAVEHGDIQSNATLCLRRKLRKEVCPNSVYLDQTVTMVDETSCPSETPLRQYNSKPTIWYEEYCTRTGSANICQRFYFPKFDSMFSFGGSIGYCGSSIV
jgi:hypothetical protein